MNRQDALSTAQYLKRLHEDYSTQLGDTPDTPTNRRVRAKLVKTLDDIARLNRLTLKEYRREPAAKKTPDIKVGECPCGLPIMISSRYAVNTKSPTTINRKCQGYRCGRINAVILTTNIKVQRATWKAIDCRCGGEIHLRSDYAGGPRFRGSDIEGMTKFDLMVDRGEDQKNRTVKIECPRCDCKYTLVIRFIKGEGDAVTRSITADSTISRCAGCKYREPTSATG